MSTAIEQIRERIEEILENIIPDVSPITLRRWLDSRDILTGAHTESAATTTRQFQVIALPVREPGFLGGGSVDQWQTIRITIRYYMGDTSAGWVDVHTLAAADSASIYEALTDDTQWTGTSAEGAGIADAVPLTPHPTTANLGFQVLHYRILYNRCNAGEGGKWARNFADIDELTAYLLTQDIGTFACLINSDGVLLQLYQRTASGVEPLTVGGFQAGDVPDFANTAAMEAATLFGEELGSIGSDVYQIIAGAATQLGVVSTPAAQGYTTITDLRSVPGTYSGQQALLWTGPGGDPLAWLRWSTLLAEWIPTRIYWRGLSAAGQAAWDAIATGVAHTWTANGLSGDAVGLLTFADIWPTGVTREAIRLCPVDFRVTALCAATDTAETAAMMMWDGDNEGFGFDMLRSANNMRAGTLQKRAGVHTRNNFNATSFDGFVTGQAGISNDIVQSEGLSKSIYRETDNTLGTELAADSGVITHLNTNLAMLFGLDVVTIGDSPMEIAQVDMMWGIP